MPTPTFTDCSCPHCKASLGNVPETTETCPACGKALDRMAVWETRKYPGVLFLPVWVTAFGWPLLLIAAGVGFAAWVYLESGRFEPLVAGVPVAIGVVFFVVKLNGMDR